MQELHISTLSGFLDAIEKLKTQYPNRMIGNNPAAINFLYRGVSDAENHKLLPGLLRTQNDTYDEEIGRSVKNSKYLSYGKESDILSSFIREASCVVSLPPEDLSKWAEYAQHYGVPTRFLDWSSNPLVALYFACKSGEKEARVWLLHKDNYERNPLVINQMEKRTIGVVIDEILGGSKDYRYPLIYLPYYLDARMSAQSSFFMVWGAEEKPFEEMFSDEKYCMRLPENNNEFRTYGTHEAEALLFSFLIYADRKQPLLRELDTVGINEKTLFPGLDGIGRYVERKYRFNYNELVENL